MLTTVTDATFAADVLAADRPVLVDVWAGWCPPCHRLEPVVAALAAEHPELRVVKADADANPGIVRAYGVLSLPTLLLFERGAETLRLVGAVPRRRLEAELASVLA